MDPVLDAGTVDLAEHVLLASDTAEYEEGVVLAIADFGG